MVCEKKVLVVAASDAEEAMRVAAGLTIFGHKVEFLFTEAVDVTALFQERAELLDLADIDQVCSAVPFEECDVVSAKQISQMITNCDFSLII